MVFDVFYINQSLESFHKQWKPIFGICFSAAGNPPQRPSSMLSLANRQGSPKLTTSGTRATKVETLALQIFTSWTCQNEPYRKNEQKSQRWPLKNGQKYPKSKKKHQMSETTSAAQQFQIDSSTVGQSFHSAKCFICEQQVGPRRGEKEQERFRGNRPKNGANSQDHNKPKENKQHSLEPGKI